MSENVVKEMEDTGFDNDDNHNWFSKWIYLEI